MGKKVRKRVMKKWLMVDNRRWLGRVEGKLRKKGEKEVN